MTLECPKCHFKNPTDTRFCGQCGASLPKKIPSPSVSRPKGVSEDTAITLEMPIDEFELGATFAGRYQIIEKLGEGGMGKIYKVLDKEVGAKVALKLLRPEIAADKRTIDRFRNELRIARTISHKNICRMYDLDKEKEKYYITMEYVPGEDLKSMISMTRRLSIATALDIAKQVCEGLAEAHSLGVVHRDIKPGNIVINKQGQAKIMDFGLARSLKGKAETDEGLIIGTVPYMSPEQVEGKKVDQRSDIYSLGIVLFEMLTGRLPFEGETPLSTAIKHKIEPPPAPKDFNPEIPDELSRLILKCLEKQPEKRFQSAEELLEELKVVEESTAIRPKAAPKKAYFSLKKTYEWMRGNWIFMAALFMLVIVAGIVLFSSRKETQVAPRKKSMLVVLPFDNLGSAEDEYFADGLSEEITSRLAALHGLGVISRTSAVFYKKTNKSIKEIGAELNVDYGLTGTVRWDRKPGGRDRVRVTPQLIRVSDDTQLWSESYDRVFQDLFSVQSDIAEKVVKQLDIKVLEPERRALEAKPTNNLEAYDYYLRGMEAYNHAYLASDRQEHEKTIELFERAIQLDPNFIVAICVLSRVHTRMHLVGIDRTEERLAKAAEALNRALELEPDSPEVQLNLGYYYLNGLQDSERALKIFESAKRARPNIPPSFLANIQRNQGKWEEAIINYETAFRLNPRSSDIAHSLARCYAWIGNYEESEKWFDRAISISPDLYYSKLGKARLPFLARGDTKEARIRLEALEPHRLTDYNFYLLGMLDRNYQGVRGLLVGTPYDYFGEVNFYIPRDLARASIFQAMKERALTKKYADLARQELEKNITENPEDARFHASLGLAYAYLGSKQEAIREGEKAVELYPISKDAFDGTLGILNLTIIYTVVGEFDQALKELEYLLSIPCGNYFSVSVMRLDPAFDPLRQDPRFERLLEENSKGTRFRIDPKKLAAAWD